MHRVGPADRFRRRFGEPDVTNVSGLHHVGDGADRVLDRHRGIEPRGLIEIDMVGAKPPQRVGEEILHRIRPAVVAEEFEVRAAHRAEFDRDEGTLTLAALERLPDQHLVVPRPVEVAGVEHGDAGLERGMDGRNRLRVVGGMVAAGHAYSTESHFGNVRTVSTQSNKPHPKSPRALEFFRRAIPNNWSSNLSPAMQASCKPRPVRNRKPQASAALVRKSDIGGGVGDVGAGTNGMESYSAAMRTAGAAGTARRNRSRNQAGPRPGPSQCRRPWRCSRRGNGTSPAPA